jgi:type I restriction-modification system DNA methylase subunit
MTDTNQKQLGNTLWSIADQLRGAMDADDFRDYMLSFLFLRYLSDNYETAAKKELGRDYPEVDGDARRVPLALWYANNADDVPEFEKQMRRKVHYVIQPPHLWNSIANLARTQNAELLNTLQAGFKYIETESFESTFQGLFSEIDLGSSKLGKTYADRNAKLCTVIQKIAEGLAEFSTDIDALGDAYEYLIGQFAAGAGKKAGEFYTPQRIPHESQEPRTGPKKRLESVMDMTCGSGSLLLNVRKMMNQTGGTIGKISGQEMNITTYNLARMNMLLHGVKDTEFEIFHGDTLLNEWDIMREQNPAKKPSFDAIVANPPLQPALGTHRCARRRRAFQEPRPRPEVRRRLRLPPARLPLPEGRRRDGDHPAARGALPRRGRGTHPHQAAQGRPHRHRHRPARESVLLHRHPRLHPRAQEVQEARRRSFHQRRRALREGQAPEPTERGAHRQDHRHLPESHGRRSLRTPGGNGRD